MSARGAKPTVTPAQRLAIIAMVRDLQPYKKIVNDLGLIGRGGKPLSLAGLSKIITMERGRDPTIPAYAYARNVRISDDIVRALTPEANKRHISVIRLVHMIVDVVATDHLVNSVLDDGVSNGPT